MTDTIFWDCGTQRDLADLDGGLYVPGTESIRPRLRRLAETARERKIPRLCTVVAHRDGDPDITAGKPDYKATYPVHCLEGGDGWRQIPETACARPVEISREPHAARPVRESLQAYHDEVLIDLAGFDPWIHPAVGTYLEIVAPRRVVLYGVPADKMVAAAVAGLLERGVAVTLVEDALRPFDQRAWDQMKAGWADKPVTWVRHSDLVG
jgi:nicotinamidase-related amidase